jgi:hypothetical protein
MRDEEPFMNKLTWYDDGFESYENQNVRKTRRVRTHRVMVAEGEAMLKGG